MSKNTTETEFTPEQRKAVREEMITTLNEQLEVLLVREKYEICLASIEKAKAEQLFFMREQIKHKSAFNGSNTPNPSSDESK